MSRNHRRDGPGRLDRKPCLDRFGTPAETPTLPGGPNYFRDFWVFVIGPVTGATVAAAYYKVINAMQDKEAENEPAAADRADTDVKPVEA